MLWGSPVVCVKTAFTWLEKALFFKHDMRKKTQQTEKC